MKNTTINSPEAALKVHEWVQINLVPDINRDYSLIGDYLSLFESTGSMVERLCEGVRRESEYGSKLAWEFSEADLYSYDHFLENHIRINRENKEKLKNTSNLSLYAMILILLGGMFLGLSGDYFRLLALVTIAAGLLANILNMVLLWQAMRRQHIYGETQRACRAALRQNEFTVQEVLH